MWAPVLPFLALAGACLAMVKVEVPVQPDFQQDQFLGRWFSIGLASNSQWFQDKKPVMKMCSTVVSPVAEGNLDVTSTYSKHGRCETRKSLFVRTEQPGRFTYTSSRSGTASDVRVVETDYNQYALVFGQKVKDGETFVMVTLYGRRKQDSLVQMFEGRSGKMQKVGFAGRWYPIRLVMNPDGETKEIAIVGRMAVSKPNGDIDMDTEGLDKGECVTKMTTFLHTDKPGVFTTDEGNTIHVVETDYETFHVLHVDTKIYKVLHLEVRDLGNHEDRIKKFKLLASSLGFSEDKIVEVPRTGSCLK